MAQLIVRNLPDERWLLRVTSAYADRIHPLEEEAAHSRAHSACCQTGLFSGPVVGQGGEASTCVSTRCSSRAPAE
jgi:hypothetical protein